MAAADGRVFDRLSEGELAAVAALRWNGSPVEEIARETGLRISDISPVIRYMGVGRTKLGRPAGHDDVIGAVRDEIDEAFTKIEAEWGVGKEALLADDRSLHISMARQEMMAELRAIGLSLPAIAKVLHRKDHTTIMHGLKQRKKRAAA